MTLFQTKIMKAPIPSLLTVTVCFLWMVWMVKKTSIFKSVPVDLGFGHYAEPVVRYGNTAFMPMNTIVNIAYTFVGSYWLRFANCNQKFSSSSARMVSVAAWMAILYGPVQLWRIVYQTRPSAVLDQWVTTPFFMWVFIWCQSIDSNIGAYQYIPLMMLSVYSYFLCLLFTRGFEFILGAHIFIVTCYAARLQRRYGNSKTKGAFTKALLCCVGFVVLKLLDLQLGKFVLFQRFSGHFWSKICDALQLHYSCQFLTDMALLKAKVNS